MMTLDTETMAARRARARLYCLLALALGVLPARGAAAPQQNAKKRLGAARLSRPLQLDGRVREEDWLQAEPALDFIQQLPRSGMPSSEKTEVRAAFDEHFLYFGIICYDSEPEKILSTQNRRDGDLIDTDSFQILLDSYGDGQDAFVFGTTPTGIEYDGQVSRAGQSGGTLSSSRGGGAGGSGGRIGRGPGGAQRGGASAFNLNWDGVWEVRAAATERGWEAEFAIPFKTLRFRNSGDHPWGVNFMRVIRRRNEQAFWSPVEIGFDLFRVSLAGELVGVEARLHRTLQAIPYALAGVQQNFMQEGDPTDGVHEFGLDLKYTLTSSLTLDATVNTDFAQVEVDEEQINITRFDLFFPEKRPFFLESSGNFEFGAPREVELFFSRRIGIDRSGNQVPIAGGARVTGKLGNFSLGVLNMQTESVGEDISANNFNVVRVRRELRNRSAVGAIAVSRVATGGFAGAEDHNHTFGLDANLGFGENLTLFSFLAKSDSPGRPGNDYAGRALLQFEGKLLEWRAGYTQVGKDFNPEAGFLRRSGYRKPEWALYASPRPKWRSVRRLYPHVTGEDYYGEDGKLQSRFFHNDFRVEFTNGGNIGIARNINVERLEAPFDINPGVASIPAGRYSFGEWVVNFASDPSANLFADGNYTDGGFYDGKIRTVNVNAGFRKGSNLLISGRYLRNRVRLKAGEYTNTLVGMRFNYSFTNRSYFQSLVQYNSQIRQVSGNFRFAYLLSSSTGLFVVYNTHLDTFARTFDEEFRRRTIDRVFLVKFSYLFRL